MPSELMELKAYKMLAQIRGRFMSSVVHNAKNKLEYSKDKPEELFKFTESIGNPEKWDYYGVLDLKDKHIMEILEYLLDDDVKEIIKRK